MSEAPDAPKSSQPAIPGPGGIETVSLDKLSQRIPPPKARTYLEWSGVRQMNILLGGICAMVGLFFLAWVFTRPGLEQATALIEAARGTLGANAGGTPVQVDQFATILGDLRSNHFERFRDMFQLIVVGALVPLFTLLAGYVFGRGQRPSSNSQDEGDE